MCCQAELMMRNNSRIVSIGRTADRQDLSILNLCTARTFSRNSCTLLAACSVLNDRIAPSPFTITSATLFNLVTFMFLRRHVGTFPFICFVFFVAVNFCLTLVFGLHNFAQFQRQNYVWNTLTMYLFRSSSLSVVLLGVKM